MPETEFYITAVERHPKSSKRYLIFINGTYHLTIHEDVLVKHRLLKGENIEPDRLQQVTEEEERHRVWSDALRYIGRRPRTEHEMRLHLKRKQYAPELIEAAIDKLKEHRYMDDVDFAAQWTAYKMISQRKGRMWVKQELQQKGIDSATIRDALMEVSPEREEEAAMETARKKWPTVSGTCIDKKRKTAAFLMCRGYSSAIAGKVVRRLASEEPLENGEAEDDWDESL